MTRLFRKKVNTATKVSGKNNHLLDVKQPFAYSEAYKSLRTNLKFSTLGKEMKKIVVTSAVPGEGKSTLVINLGITLADSGMKVLIVDADLRNPSIHRYFRLRQTDLPGLSFLLSSKENPQGSIGHLDKNNLDLLLSGQIPPNPAELLGTDRLKEILDSLVDTYDYILIDAPPVSIVTDAAEISQACDGTILVIGQKMSTQEQVLRAKQNLMKVGANILGVVLNNYDLRSNNKAEEHYHYYYGQED